jgi:hypothetical protein
MAIGNGNSLHRSLGEGFRVRGIVGSHPTNKFSNSLASFVQHMMCHNFVNPQCQRRVASHGTGSCGPVAKEMDEIVRVIEEWEKGSDLPNRT